MEQSYAQALLILIQKGERPAEAVRKLKSALEEKGRASLLPKIARAFARLAAHRDIAERLTLSVARQEDLKTALKEAESLLAEHRITDVDLDEAVDESLIGGWRLEGHGLLVDRSWKSKLLSMYNRATQ